MLNFWTPTRERVCSTISSTVMPTVFVSHDLMQIQLMECSIKETLTTWTFKPIMAPGNSLRSGSSCVEGFLQIGSGCLQGLSMTYCNFEFNHEDPRQSLTSSGGPNITISLTRVLRKEDRKRSFGKIQLCDKGRLGHYGRGDSFEEITDLCFSRFLLGSSLLLCRGMDYRLS